MSLKYFFGAILTIPLLPIMYYQGKKIRASVPSLPEAKGLSGASFPSSHSPKKLKLLAIGESTIAGVGVETHEEGFVGSLANKLSKLMETSIEWKVYARSGYTAKKVVNLIIPKISEEEVDIVLVGLGGNNAFALDSPEKWKNEVRQLIKVIIEKFPDSMIVFCNMPPIKEFPAFTPLIKFTIGNLVEMYGEELTSLAKQYQNVFYNAEIITLDFWIEKLGNHFQPLDFFSDGVHPSKLTYQTWAEDLASKIAAEYYPAFQKNRLK